MSRDAHWKQIHIGESDAGYVHVDWLLGVLRKAVAPAVSINEAQMESGALVGDDLTVAEALGLLFGILDERDVAQALFYATKQGAVKGVLTAAVKCLSSAKPPAPKATNPVSSEDIAKLAKALITANGAVARSAKAIDGTKAGTPKYAKLYAIWQRATADAGRANQALLAAKARVATPAASASASAAASRSFMNVEQLKLILASGASKATRSYPKLLAYVVNHSARGASSS